MNFSHFLSSYFAASKYALPHLRKTKGNIINVSSLVGHIGVNFTNILQSAFLYESAFRSYNLAM